MRAVETEYYNAVVKLDNVYGFDVNETDTQHGYTPFFCAYRAKDPRILDFLVEKGADYNIKTGGYDLFSIACDWLYESDFNLAVENGVMAKLFSIIRPDPNGWDASGKTPLAHAASHGNLDFFNFLIENGADIRHPTRDGSLPINYAIQRKHYNIVERLFDLGYKINEFPANAKIPPIHFLAKFSFFPAYFRLQMRELLKLGADFNIRDHDGRTALHIAAMNGNLAFINEIVSVYKADINAVDNNYKRPIDLTEDKRTITTLLKHGSKPKRKWYDIFSCFMN